jgi:hypothetical protein
MANFKVTSAEVSDVIVRAAKTFVQAFVAQLLITNGTYSKQTEISAVAAGVSAVLNLAYNRTK